MRTKLIVSLLAVGIAHPAFARQVVVRVNNNPFQAYTNDNSIITIPLDGDTSQNDLQPISTPTLVVIRDDTPGGLPSMSVRRIVLQGSVIEGGRVDVAIVRKPNPLAPDVFPDRPDQLFSNAILGLKYLGARPAGYYDEFDPGDPVEPLGDPENPHAGKILVFEKPGDPLDTSLRDHTRLAIGVVEAIHGNNYPATIGVGQVFRVQAGTLGSSPVGDITADIFSSAPDGGVVPGEDSIGYVIAGNRIAGDIQSAGNLFRVAVGPSPAAKGLVPPGFGQLRIAAEGSVEQVFSTGPMGGGGRGRYVGAHRGQGSRGPGAHRSRGRRDRRSQGARDREGRAVQGGWHGYPLKTRVGSSECPYPCHPPSTVAQWVVEAETAYGSFRQRAGGPTRATTLFLESRALDLRTRSARLSKMFSEGTWVTGVEGTWVARGRDG